MPKVPDCCIWDLGDRVFAGPDKREVMARLMEVSADPARYGCGNCRLCKRRSVTVAWFAPFPGTDLALWVRQPEGKTRFIFYGLCKRCLALPADVRNARVEQSIHEEHDQSKPVQ